MMFFDTQEAQLLSGAASGASLAQAPDQKPGDGAILSVACRGNS